MSKNNIDNKSLDKLETLINQVETLGDKAPIDLILDLMNNSNVIASPELISVCHTADKFADEASVARNNLKDLHSSYDKIVSDAKKVDSAKNSYEKDFSDAVKTIKSTDSKRKELIKASKRAGINIDTCIDNPVIKHVTSFSSNDINKATRKLLGSNIMNIRERKINEKTEYFS